MAVSISLKLTGAVQGEMQGESRVVTNNREHEIEIFSFSQALQISFDRATAQATGRRFYQPLTFTKFADRSTPLIRHALTTNESVGAIFRWFKPDQNGADQNFLTLTLTNARIASAVLRLTDTLNPANASLPALDDVTMVFDQITWTSVTGGTTAQDEWSSVR